MLNKENIEITLPSKEYLENSALIRKIGFIGKTLDCEDTDYWTSTSSYTSYNNQSYQFRMSSDNSFCHTPASEECGVRPIIIASDLENIVKSSPFKAYNKGFKMIELGKWYRPNPLKITDLKPTFAFKNRYFKASPKEIGLEIDTSDGLFAITADEIHKIVPIHWYYDEENNLLLSKNVLFNSPLTDENNPFFGDFKTTSLYKNLNNEFLSSLLDSLQPQISDANNETLTKLLKENQKLKKENENLSERLEISKQKIKKLKK